MREFPCDLLSCNLPKGGCSYLHAATPEQFVFLGESKPLARSVTSQKKSVHIVKIAY